MNRQKKKNGPFTQGKGQLERSGTREKRKVLLFGGLAAFLLFTALTARWIVPFDPYEQDLSSALMPPGGAHLFGTDRYGRDLFSRVLVGAQTTVFSALLTVLIITVSGTIIGIFCGWTGGKADTVLMRAADVFLSFPGMVFAIAVAGVLGGGLWNAVLALCLVSWPKYARLARGQVLAVRSMPYLAAARIGGCGTSAILFRHLLPNIAGSILVTAFLDIGTMIMELAGLSFLGLGAQPPTAEWGSMMSNGRSMLQTCPWTILAPGAAIFVTVTIFHLLGDAVRDALDSRE